MSTVTSYRSKIERALSRLGHNGTENPDKSNSGNILGDYYLWKIVTAYAERREKTPISA
jgi:hypothetical protein